MFKLICFVVILVVAYEMSSAEAFRRRNRNKDSFSINKWANGHKLKVKEITKEECKRGDDCWKPRPKCRGSDCGGSSSCKGSNCGGRRRCRYGRCPPFIVIPPITPPVTLEPVTTTMASGNGTTAAPGNGTTAAPGTVTTGAPGTVTTGAPGNVTTGAPGTVTTPVTQAPTTTQCPPDTELTAVNIDALNAARTVLGAMTVDNLLAQARQTIGNIATICLSAATSQQLRTLNVTNVTLNIP